MALDERKIMQRVSVALIVVGGVAFFGTLLYAGFSVSPIAGVMLSGALALAVGLTIAGVYS